MKAHKVPATYYASWKNPGTKQSFYVFYKNDVNQEGKSKRYTDVDKITQEHAYFMEEDFYYLDIKKIPGLVYKLQHEIELFISEYEYDIKCYDFSDENNESNYQIIKIDDYDKFVSYREYIDSWIIEDINGNRVANNIFQNDLTTFLFDKVGKIIEVDYFANELEPKWNVIKKEIETERNTGDIFCLTNKADFLEFFIIQYLRLDGVIVNDIEPTVKKVRNVFSSMGFEESELNEMKKGGLLAPKSYFYSALLDAARGNKKRIQKQIDLLEENYVIDLLKAKSGISFITSTSPCVVTKKIGTFKAEMIFPVTPQYCIRFVGKKIVENRNGMFFEITENEVKDINRKIIFESNDIVMSESKFITDRI